MQIEHLDRITHLVAALHAEMRPLEPSLPPVEKIIDAHVNHLKLLCRKHAMYAIWTMTSIKHTTKFEIAQSADKLFPLFSAEGEKKWDILLKKFFKTKSHQPFRIKSLILSKN